MRKPGKPDHQEILAVRCDARLIAAVDAIAERQFRSRSDVVRQAVLRELEAHGICAVAA